MRAICATAVLWATLVLIALIAPSGFQPSFAGGSDAPEKTVPQGQDPPGHDNAEQPVPPQSEDKEVIPPPPIGDEDIYTQAPNPEAGHEEEVIPPPPPALDEESHANPR
jgi:hypothetical protein